MGGRSTERSGGRSGRAALLRLLLSCALVGALLAAGASYASYSSTGGAEDGARVAGGLVKVEYGKTEEVDADGNPKINLVRPSTDGILTKSFYFSVSNGTGHASEVAIKYDITVALEQSDTLPDGVTINLMQEGNDQPLDSIGGGGDGDVLVASGVFEPGEAGMHGYSIDFAGDFDTIQSGTETSDYVHVTVKAEQVD